LLGPHMFNFAQATEDAVRIGAARQCADAAVMVSEMTRLLLTEDGQQELSQMRANTQVFTQAYTGATEKTMGLLAGYL